MYDQNRPFKNHPNAIPALAHIWHEVLGKIWFPELTIQEIESLTYDELNTCDETTSFVALCDEIPVGFCTFKLKEASVASIAAMVITYVVGSCDE